MTSTSLTSVSTDKADYAPGETALVAGTGFLVGETVRLQVTRTDGVSGAFQDEFLVHRRRGEPCPECGSEVVKFVAAGRGTYACESCQPPPRARRS